MVGFSAIQYIMGLLERCQALRRAIQGIMKAIVNVLLADIFQHKRLRGFRRRYLVLRTWHITLGISILYKLLKRLYRSIAVSNTKNSLYTKMNLATNYEDFKQAATQLDEIQCLSLPVPIERIKSLQTKTKHMQALIRNGDIQSLTSMLRQDSSRSVGGLLSTAAEQGKVHCIIPPPEVTEYIQETERALHHICHCDELSVDDRLSFMKELRHAYGRTALCLSGGGSFGHWHFGIVRVLLKESLLPRIVSGSSAGAIGCAMLATRTDAELADTVDQWIHHKDTDFFGTEKSIKDFVTHLLTKGTLHAHQEFVLRLQRLFGDLTFREAYARTGRILNICVVAADTTEPSRLLNYLSAPNVIIWSAVACSSAFPFLFSPQELLAKDPAGHVVPYHWGSSVIAGLDTVVAGSGGLQRRWCDGSLEEDLPMRGLSEMFNVNYFLVSQANPYLIPILGFRSMFPRKMQKLGEWEFKHRLSQLLAIWPNSRICKLLSQPWEGDLNFVLPWNKFSLVQSAKNFSAEEILMAMEEVSNYCCCY